MRLLRISLVIACCTLLASCVSFDLVTKHVSTGGFERTLVYISDNKPDANTVIASVLNEVMIQSQVPFLQLTSNGHGISSYKGQEYILDCPSDLVCNLSLSFVNRHVFQYKTKELVQTLDFTLELQEVAGGYAARLSVPDTITTKDQSFLTIQFFPIISEAELDAYFKRLKKIKPLLPVQEKSWFPKKLVRKLGIYGKVATFLLDEFDKRDIKGTLPPSRSFNRSSQ